MLTYAGTARMAELGRSRLGHNRPNHTRNAIQKAGGRTDHEVRNYGRTEFFGQATVGQWSQGDPTPSFEASEEHSGDANQDRAA